MVFGITTEIMAEEMERTGLASTGDAGEKTGTVLLPGSVVDITTSINEVLGQGELTPGSDSAEGGVP